MRTLTLALATVSTLIAVDVHAQPAPPPAEPAPTDPAAPADPATPPVEPAPVKPETVAAPVDDKTVETTSPPAAPASDDLNYAKLGSVALGGGGALLALGALSYELAAQASLSDAHHADDPRTRASLHDDADHNHHIAAAMAVGGVLCVAGSVLLYFHSQPDVKEGSKKVSVMPLVTGDGGGFVVGGRF